MRKRTLPLTILRCLHFICLPSLLLAGVYSVVMADDEATASPVFSTTQSWSEIATATVGVGVDEDGEGQSGAEFLAPVFWDGTNLMFLYPDLQVREGGERDLSIGFGFRHLVGDKMILGTNAFYDITESGYGHNVGQFGVGAEVLMQRFRARGNYYKPEGARTKIDEETVERQFESTRVKGNTSPVVGDPMATGYGIFRDVTLNYQLEHIRRTESYLFERFEQGMEGYEFEAGVLAPFVDQFGDLWVYGGYYQYNNPFGGTVEGPMARAEAQLTDHLIFDAAFFDDPGISGTGGNWTFGLRASFPLGGKYASEDRPRGILNGIGRALTGKGPRPMTPLPSQIGQNIIRNNRVRLVESDFIENKKEREVTIEKEIETVSERERIQVAALLAGVGAPGLLDIIFVDINAAAGGNGTAERPFQTITEAQMLADSRSASLGRTQGIYVQTRAGAYVDNVTFNQAGGSFALVDSSIPLPLQGGGTFGGGTAAASWMPTMGSALVVDGVNQFAFGGFDIVTNGMAPGVMISDVNGPVIPPPAGVIPTEAFHFVGGTSIDSTGGPALEISNSAVSGSVMSLTSTNSASSGVSLTNMSGSLSVTGDLMVTGSTSDGLVIDTVPGDFSVAGLTTLTSGAPVPGIDGIDIQDSSGNFTFASVDIDGWEDGVDLEDNTGTTSILGGTIDGTLDNGIESIDSNLVASNLNIGSNTAIGNDGIAIEGNVGMTSTSLSGITITEVDDEGIQVETFGGSHQMALSDITILDSGETGIAMDGFGGGLLTVTDFNGITITDANTDAEFDEGGIFFDTVTFDADPTTMAIDQVNAGNVSIGTMGNRVDGFGLVLLDPTGDLGINMLNIFNDGDTGLVVDTKLGGTTFNLDVAGGSIDTINGSAMFLDPLSGDINLTSVTSVDAINTNGGGFFDPFGVYIDEYAGSLNIGTVNVQNAVGGGFAVLNSSADVTVGDLTVDGVADLFGDDGLGVLVADNTGSFTVTGATMVSNADFAGVIVSNADADFQGLITATDNDDVGIFLEGTGNKMIGGAQVSGSDVGIVVSDSGIFGAGTGNVTFGDVSVTDVVDFGIDILDTGGAIQFGAVTVGTMGMASSGGDIGVSVEAQTGGSVTFGSLNINETDSFGFYGSDNEGTVTANGTTIINGVGGAGIGIEGVNTGSYAFNSVAINLENDNTTALSLNGATLNGGGFSANDFEATSTTAVGTTGIDLVNATGTGPVAIGDGIVGGMNDANIAGVNDGVLFSSTTNLDSFTFGDGENMTDVDSSIDAVTPINHDGSGLPMNGTYDFEDVNLIGDTSNLMGPTFFVFDDLGTMGAGTFADPGTLAQAEAAMADILIAIDSTVDAMSDLIDFNAQGDGTLNLDDGQGLVSMIGGQSFNGGVLGFGGAPNNFLLNGISGSTITAPNMGIDSVLPTLFSTGNTVVIGGAGGIANSQIVSTGQIGLSGVGAFTGDFILQDVDVSGDNAGIFIGSTAGGFSVTGSGNSATATGTGSALFLDNLSIGAAGLGFDNIQSNGAPVVSGMTLNSVSGPGTVTVNNANLNSSLAGASGLSLTNVTADVDVTAGTIGASGASNGAVTINGGTGNVNIGAAINSTAANGGISIINRTGGVVTFDGLVTTNTGAGTGINLVNNTGSTLNFNGGLDLTTTTGLALNATGGGILNVADGMTDNTVNSGNGLAVNIDEMTLDVLFDEINSTRTSGGGAVTVENSDGSFTLNGGTFSAPVGGGDFSTIRFAQNDPGATRELTVAIDGVSITHDAPFAGSDEYGIGAFTEGNGSLIISVTDSMFQTEDHAVTLNSINGGITVTDMSNLTLLGDSTAGDPTLFNNGIRFAGVVFDSDLSMAGLQAVSGGNFSAGTLSDPTSLAGVFSGLATPSSGGALVATPGNQGEIVFTNYDVVTVGTGIFTSGDQSGMQLTILDGNITSGNLSIGSAGSPFNADITLSTLTLQADNGGSGLMFEEFAGAFTVTGDTLITAPETGSPFGPNLVRVENDGISIRNSSVNVQFEDLTLGTQTILTGPNPAITGGSTVGIDLEGNSGTFTVTGTTTISDTVEDAIRIADTSGAISFGATSITNPGADVIPANPILNAPEATPAAVDVSGTITAPITFADLDIALESDNTIGVDLNGATLNADFTATDFDLTSDSSSGTIGVDLAGTTGTGAVTFGETAAPFGDDSGATIGGTVGNPGGPAIGVQFDGSTDVDFVFGDGEEGVDIGSTINAGTGISGTLPPVGQGTYNFLDVNFPNGTGLTGVDVFFATIGMGQGTMDGSSFANAGSLADAEISMSDAVIVFDNVENGLQDIIDFGADTFDLDDGQVLASISQGETIDLANFGFMSNAPGGNFMFNAGTPVGGSTVVNAPGAGNNVDTVDPIILSSANVIAANNASGSLFNVHVHSTGANGIDITNTVDSEIALSGVTVQAAGTGISIDGSGGGTTSITDFSNLTVIGGVGTGTGINLNTVTFDANPADADFTGDTVNGGNLMVGSPANPVGGAGFIMSSVSGDLSFADLDIDSIGTGLDVSGTGSFNAGAGTGFRLATAAGTINSTSSSGILFDPFTANVVLDSVTANGGANGVLLDQIDGSVTINGGAISGATGDSFRINGGSVASTYFGSITHSAAGSAAVLVEGGHSGSATFSGVVNATNGTGLQFNNAVGTMYNFNNAVTLNGGDAGIDIINGSAASFTFSNTSITSPTGTAFNVDNSTGGITWTAGTITQANNASAVSFSGHSGGIINFGAGTTISATNGDGMQFSNADGVYNFNGQVTLNGGDAGIDIVNGSDGTFTFANADITSPTGAGININGGSSAVTFQGSSSLTQANNAAAVMVQGGHSGSLTYSGAVNATNGTGLQFNNAVGTTYTFNNAVTLNGGDAGIDIINGSDASFTFSNTSITSPTGTAFNVDNSSGAIAWLGGSITQNNAASALRINNHTGGIANLNGAINANTTTANAIDLVGVNTGTYNFGGTLDLDTTSGTAFNATGGGTVNVTGSGNDVDTTTGTAVNISNTTIGASGVTFQSVSAGTGAGSAGTGIILNNTGASGGFTITGDGMTAGSGGTIQNKTGANGTNNGIGIFLNNTRDVSLSHMQLNDFDNFAIRGTNVTNFDLINSVVTATGGGSNGNSAADDEGSISFDNLLGTANFNNNTIEGGFEDNIVVTNNTGSLNRMTVSGGTIGLNSTVNGNDGILVEAQGNATLNLTVTGVNFLGSRGDHIQTNALGSSSMDVVIQDNTFTNAHASSLGGGVTISGGSAGSSENVTYNVSGTMANSQTFNGAVSSAITVGPVNGNGTYNGTIQNNKIGTSGVFGSGSSGGGAGIAALAAGGSTHTVLIDTNDIDRINGAVGAIDLNTQNTGVLNATITNNTVDELDGFTLAALYSISGGAAIGDMATINADIRMNTFDGSDSFGFDVFIDQLGGSSSSYNFPGYAGPPTPGGSPNALDAFIAGQNTLVQGLIDSSSATNVTGNP